MRPCPSVSPSDRLLVHPWTRVYGFCVCVGGMGVWCPCPPVRNDIVTPRHLFSFIAAAAATLPHTFHLKVTSPTCKSVAASSKVIGAAVGAFSLSSSALVAVKCILAPGTKSLKVWATMETCSFRSIGSSVMSWSGWSWNRCGKAITLCLWRLGNREVSIALKCQTLTVHHVGYEKADVAAGSLRLIERQQLCGFRLAIHRQLLLATNAWVVKEIF